MFLRANKVIYLFAGSIKLVIQFKMKITDNCFNFLGGSIQGTSYLFRTDQQKFRKLFQQLEGIFQPKCNPNARK